MRLISLILAPSLVYGDAYIARYVWISMDLYEGFATQWDKARWLRKAVLKRQGEQGLAMRAALNVLQ